MRVDKKIVICVLVIGIGAHVTSAAFFLSRGNRQRFSPENLLLAQGSYHLAPLHMADQQYFLNTEQTKAKVKVTRTNPRQAGNRAQLQKEIAAAEAKRERLQNDIAADKKDLGTKAKKIATIDKSIAANTKLVYELRAASDAVEGAGLGGGSAFLAPVGFLGVVAAGRSALAKREQVRAEKAGAAEEAGAETARAASWALAASWGGNKIISISSSAAALEVILSNLESTDTTTPPSSTRAPENAFPSFMFKGAGIAVAGIAIAAAGKKSISSGPASSNELYLDSISGGSEGGGKRKKSTSSGLTSGSGSYLDTISGDSSSFTKKSRSPTDSSRPGVSYLNKLFGSGIGVIKKSSTSTKGDSTATGSYLDTIGKSSVAEKVLAKDPSQTAAKASPTISPDVSVSESNNPTPGISSSADTWIGRPRAGSADSYYQDELSGSGQAPTKTSSLGKTGDKVKSGSFLVSTSAKKTGDKVKSGSFLVSTSAKKTAPNKATSSGLSSAGLAGSSYLGALSGGSSTKTSTPSSTAASTSVSLSSSSYLDTLTTDSPATANISSPSSTGDSASIRSAGSPYLDALTGGSQAQSTASMPRLAADKADAVRIISEMIEDERAASEEAKVERVATEEAELSSITNLNLLENQDPLTMVEGTEVARTCIAIAAALRSTNDSRDSGGVFAGKRSSSSGPASGNSSYLDSISGGSSSSTNMP